MEKYTQPSYIVEQVEVNDIVLASSLQDAGQGTVGNITGDKAIFSNDFSAII